MPYEIVFANLPMGYAENSVREGGEVKVSYRGFFSSEDGNNMITRLEGIPQEILSLIQTTEPIPPFCVHKLLAIIRPNKTATVYLNEEITVITSVRIKGACKRGDCLTSNRILDFGKVSFNGIAIPEDAGIIFVFSAGWRKGFFYDLSALYTEGQITRTYDIEEQIGSLYSYLFFQDRFKITPLEWSFLFSHKWFPFTHLDSSILKEMILYARQSWNVDDMLPRIAHNVIELLNENVPFKHNPCFAEHSDILDHAMERYLAGDHVSCTAILYPRIEGVLRSFHRTEGYTSSQNTKNLTRVALDHHGAERIRYTLLLPKKFKEYLDSVFFAGFTPGSTPDIGRHSVAHGEARSNAFNLKASTIAILILYQLTLFLSDGSESPSA